MANPIQQASVTRKVTYLVAIAALFTVSLFVRGTIPSPAAAADVKRLSIAGQAENLDLRELDLGDAEVLGSAMRLGFTGMRGVVTTAMWRAAIEKQKRHEFQEMELLIRTVSRLQPHFITPWIFQGWNMSYNVSVENERLNDMYFYIARGLEFMAEGERMNTKVDKDGHKIGSPDLRYQIGFFYQNKFTNSDKVTTLRSLFQLSNIPPNLRKPELFRSGSGSDQTVDVREGSHFRTFCEANPQLVRRLREKLDCRKPEEVVQFLADNAKVPSRFKADSGELANPTDQFPVLPDQFKERPDEYHPRMTIDGDKFDGVLAARAWFEYAQTTLPPNPKGVDGRPIPVALVELRGDDVFKYRIPRAPAMIIFRQAPCRSQSYVAERLKKEGWFDKDTVWRPDDMRDAGSFWFKTSAVDADAEFRAHDNARDQWQKAFEMWSDYGRATGMTLSFDDRQVLMERAKIVPNRDEFAIMPLDQLVEQYKYPREAAEARQSLINLDKNRNLTNFEFFLEQARAESSAEAVVAAKLIWDAKRYEAVGNYDDAAKRYAQGLAEWRRVFELHEKYHRPERSDQTESDVFELVMKLADLVQKDRNRRELQVKAGAEAAAAGLMGGTVADPRTAKADLDRLSSPSQEWAVAATFGAATAAAGVADISRALAEREAHARIVAYERATQSAARDLTQFGLTAVASGLARGYEEFDSPDLAAQKLAALAMSSNLFGGAFEYRLYYMQLPPDVGRSEFLRWTRQYVEDETKNRLGIAKKIPPPPPGPDEPH